MNLYILKVICSLILDRICIQRSYLFAACVIIYDHHGGRADGVVHRDPATRHATFDEYSAVIDFVCILRSYVGTSVERELICFRGERDLVEVIWGWGYGR